MNLKSDKKSEMVLEKLKVRAKALKKELTALYYALQDRRLPPLPRITGLMAIAYALSPIDLIPDFIPVLGYLDDLVILPALIALTVRLIPGELMEECRKKAEQQPVSMKKNPWLAVPIILIWFAVLLLVLCKLLT